MVVPIPKVQTPTGYYDLRPISMSPPWSKLKFRCFFCCFFLLGLPPSGQGKQSPAALIFPTPCPRPAFASGAHDVCVCACVVVIFNGVVGRSLVLSVLRRGWQISLYHVLSYFGDPVFQSENYPTNKETVFLSFIIQFIL